MTKLESLLKDIIVLRGCFTEANKKYEELNKRYKINEYFDSKEHAIYKFCVAKLEESKHYQEILTNIFLITKNELIDVIFIGKCSAGKSKIINAILMENILPCALSATTHCFVEINKSNDEENYLGINKSEKKPFDFDKLISEIKNKISSKNDSYCGFNESIQIFLSQSKWQIEVTNGKQSKNIRLIDTPGYDNCMLSSNSNDNSSIEKLIIDRCKICNIIVLVVTHDLADEEIEILDQLFEIPPELPILVLVNKWDLSDNESDEITNESKSNIQNSFNNVRQTNWRIYFVSALEQTKPISSRNSNERQDEFRTFIAHLNQEINDQNISKFDEDISIIRTFFDETINKYKESVQNLINNIGNFINRLNEIKKEFENFENKIRKKIYKRKQTENEKFDSFKKSDFVDKLDKKFDLLENDLQSKLQIIYYIINENDPAFYQNLQQDKQLFATGLDKSKKPKSIRKIFQYSVREWFHNSNVDPATKPTEGSTKVCLNKNEHFCEKLLQCTNSKLKIISDQINNMLEFFPQYCEYLKNNKISSYFSLMC